MEDIVTDPDKQPPKTEKLIDELRQAEVALDHGDDREAERKIEEVIEELKHPEDGDGGHTTAAFVTIIVEATPHKWPKGEKISYAQVVTLEFPDFPQHPERTYSVTYRKGEGHHHEGILAPGDSVKVKDGMEFNVTDTGQS